MHSCVNVERDLRGAEQHGSAWRRRQRRLRCMGKFVSMSVRVALATSLHHSSGPAPVGLLEESKEREQKMMDRVCGAVEEKFEGRLSSFRCMFAGEHFVLAESLSMVGAAALRDQLAQSLGVRDDLAASVAQCVERVGSAAQRMELQPLAESILASRSVAHSHAEVIRRCRERLRLLDARVEPLEELSERFQFVSERVEVMDDWLLTPVLASDRGCWRFSGAIPGFSGRWLHDCLRIQCFAWFDLGYKFCVSLRSIPYSLRELVDYCF